jgi:AcrR family transcriptional regulator
MVSEIPGAATLRLVPTTKPTRDEKKADTRERLLVTAARAFAGQGIEATSLDEIAALAELTKGAIYSNFASKDDLVLAVVERFSTTPQEVADLPGETWEEVAEHLATQTLDLLARHGITPARQLAEVELYALRRPEFRGRVEARATARRKALGDALQAKADAIGASLPLSTEAVILIVDTLMGGLPLRRLLYGPVTVPDRLFADALRLVFGVAPSPSTRPSRRRSKPGATE